MTTIKSTAYEVGYGRPPQEHQFKIGARSPNPNGHRPKSVSPNVDVAEILNEPVTIKIDGRRRRVPFLVGLMHVLKSKALKGDLRSAKMISRFVRKSASADCDSCEKLREEMTTKMYKPEPDHLRKSLEAYGRAGASRQRPTNRPSNSI